MKLIFDEEMEGFVCPQESDPEQGHETGQKKNFYCAIDVSIKINAIDSFIQITGHSAELSGVVTVPGLGVNLSIVKGEFNLFDIGLNQTNNKTEKKMEYHIWFKSEIGEDYYFYGQKHLFHNPDEFDVIEDMTTLYTKIYKGDKKDDAQLYGSGIIHFATTDTLNLLASMRVEDADSAEEKIQAITKFMNFAYEEVLEIYFNRIGFFYRTDYQNLVLSGSTMVDGKKNHIFFYGGAHDKGFPWGDEETFWDIGLIIGHYENDMLVITAKYLIADTTLKNNMKISVSDGIFSYTGKLYQLKDGYSVSFSDDLADPGNCELFEEVDAELNFEFTAAVPVNAKGHDVDAVMVPFAVPASLNIPFLGYMNSRLKQFFPNRHPLGIHLGIRSVSFEKAEIKINNKEIGLDLASAWGEAEDSTMNFVKEPTLFYNYFCAVNPANKSIRVHVEGDVLFNDTTRPLKNLFDHALSTIARQFSSMEVKLKDENLTQIENVPKPLSIKDDYILEVNYDHFKTGVFQRRIVLLHDEMNAPMLALEEDMKRINLHGIEPDPGEACQTNSPLDKKISSVAIFQSKRNWPQELEDPDRDKPGLWDNIVSLFNLDEKEVPEGAGATKRLALEKNDKKLLLRKVIQETNFKEALINRAKEQNKERDELLIVIKPNFMFLYNKADHTTYTDPLLIHTLIDFLYENGFTNIYIVEAQSTYGEYFKNRDVLSVAKYIGLNKSDQYSVVDLSDPTQWIQPTPPLPPPIADHKVHKIWANADFRISFAKNKTHTYAYYTLCLKNIYGALPLADKFKEYHCKKGIYGSTIEYLTRYPVHFGFIDAYVSADGPFGIFTDKTPNYTRTLIGGENIVAVDWVGASKMGLNPSISEYMERAVKRFGKPRIKLRGDIKQELYSPWENVPHQLSWSANTILDDHYKIGNIFYSAFSNMDEDAFPRKDDSLFLKLARFLNKPIRDMFFKQGNDAERRKLMKSFYDAGPFDEPEV